MLLLILFYTIFLTTMAIVGGYLTKKRGCHISIIGIYAIALLFFGCIPLMFEGNKIMEISKMRDSEIDNLCSMDNMALA